MANSGITPEDKKFLRKMGNKIKSLRLEKGWTLEQTEEHGWSNWQHLQKIETGKNITVVTLKKIAQLYKVKMSELFE